MLIPERALSIHYVPQKRHFDPLSTTRNVRKPFGPVKAPVERRCGLHTWSLAVCSDARRRLHFRWPARRRRSSVSAVPTPEAPLAIARRLFAKGDIVAARRELGARAEDPSRPESDRALARELASATRIDRGALLVGLACAGLLLLVVLVTALKQP